MILQLAPTLAVKITSKDNGEAVALFLIDYGSESDLLFVVAMRETGEIWAVPSYEVRLFDNWSLGRPIKQE